MAIRTTEAGADRVESALRSIDKRTTERAGVSLFHVLTLASIVGAVVLFLRGRKLEGIFMGLWPPTFEALSSAARRR